MGSKHNRLFGLREEIGLADQGVQPVGINDEWLIGFDDQELKKLFASPPRLPESGADGNDGCGLDRAFEDRTRRQRSRCSPFESLGSG